MPYCGKCAMLDLAPYFLFCLSFTLHVFATPYQSSSRRHTLGANHLWIYFSHTLVVFQATSKLTGSRSPSSLTISTAAPIYHSRQIIVASRCVSTVHLLAIEAVTPFTRLRLAFVRVVRQTSDMLNHYIGTISSSSTPPPPQHWASNSPCLLHSARHLSPESPWPSPAFSGEYPVLGCSRAVLKGGRGLGPWRKEWRWIA